MTAGDSFFAVVQFHNSNDIDISITDPSGETVGQTFAGDNHHGVDLLDAPTTGTYTVEITNNAETASFDFLVDHTDTDGQGVESDEVPEPLEEGTYTDQSIDAGETINYAAELTAGDRFITGANFPSTADLEVTVTDPEGNEVGYHESGDSYDYVELPEAAHDGTYLVTIANEGDATDYTFEVIHETNAESEPEPEPEPDNVPEPLETGYYSALEIDAGETLTYDAQLATNDLFQAAVPA